MSKKIVFNPFTCTFDYVSEEDLSGYFKLDQTQEPSGVAQTVITDGLYWWNKPQFEGATFLKDTVLIANGYYEGDHALKITGFDVNEEDTLYDYSILDKNGVWSINHAIDGDYEINYKIAEGSVKTSPSLGNWTNWIGFDGGCGGGLSGYFTINEQIYPEQMPFKLGNYTIVFTSGQLVGQQLWITNLTHGTDDRIDIRICGNYKPAVGDTFEIYHVQTGEGLKDERILVREAYAERIRVEDLTPETLVYSDVNKAISSLDTSTYPNLTELSYVKGVTDDIQTQIDALVPYTGSDKTVDLNDQHILAKYHYGETVPAITVATGSVSGLSTPTSGDYVGTDEIRASGQLATINSYLTDKDKWINEKGWYLSMSSGLNSGSEYPLVYMRQGVGPLLSSLYFHTEQNTTGLTSGDTFSLVYRPINGIWEDELQTKQLTVTDTFIMRGNNYYFGPTFQVEGLPKENNITFLGDAANASILSRLVGQNTNSVGCFVSKPDSLTVNTTTENIFGYGNSIQKFSQGTGSVAKYVGFINSLPNGFSGASYSGTVSDVIGFNAILGQGFFDTGKLLNQYGMRIEAGENIRGNNIYGLYIDDIASQSPTSSTVYNIYSSGSNNYFKGIKADDYKSSDGSSGITNTITFYAATSSSGSADSLNTIQIKNGLITSWTQV